jgi:hypothetical protein
MRNPFKLMVNQLPKYKILILKGIIIGLILIVSIFIKVEKPWVSDDPNPAPENPESQTNIHLEDGWRSATVTQSSHKKIDQSTSEMKVMVKKNKVVQIDLGNGKILHDGENESGYFFSGGVLSFEFDIASNSTIATTSVIIKDAGGNLSFYVIRIVSVTKKR